jgi:Protein of unknown function (DUF3237)
VKNQNTGLSEREEFFMIGEKIYEYDLDITGVADFGVSLQAIAAGEVTVPPQGARFDIAFDGRGKGRISGRVRDYLRLRADGRLNLDIRATIETGDGHRIALSAGGVGVPRAGEPITDLFENVCLTTAAADYAWVNARQIWGVGTASFATGKIHVEGYLQ